MIDKIYFVCGNKNKINEIKSSLPDYHIIPIEIDLEEIQGTAQEIINAKIKLAFKIISEKFGENKYESIKIICEDTSLYFMQWSNVVNNDEYDGLPGPYIKHFMTNQVGCANLVKMLQPFENKEAVAQCIFAYFTRDEDNPKIFSGICKGEIVEPRGENGFGWDTIFKPNDCDKTFAQFSFDEKISYNTPRKIALENLKTFLNSFN